MNFELGDRLRASASVIAQAAIERDYACRPLLLDRYGEDGRSRYREDMLYNLTALAAAVDADDSRMFLRYIAWLKIVLVTRVSFAATSQKVSDASRSR